MAYSSGMLLERVAVMVRDDEQSGDFGRSSAGRKYRYAATFQTAFDFNRGTKSLREGAVDGYDRVMFRMRYNKVVDRNSMLVYKGKTYQIESFNADWRQITIQITAVETPGQDLTSLLPQPTSSVPETPAEPELEPTTL